MDDPAQPGADFLADGGAMGGRLRAFDWSAHALGSPSRWPQALRTSARLMLNTGHPVLIFWGPDLHCLYNDAFAVSLGPEKHPAMLGAPALSMWAEVWPAIGGQIEAVMAGRAFAWHENQHVPIVRHGKLDDAWWTYSYTPIDDGGRVGGVLVLCAETTAHVRHVQERLAERARQQRLMVDAPGFIIVMEGPEHVVRFVNDRHRQVFDSAEWVGKPIRDAFPGLATVEFFHRLDEVFATGRMFDARDTAVRFARGADDPVETRFLDFTYAPLIGETGRITGVLCEGTDVTAAHDAQRRLLESEARFRFLYQLSEATKESTDAEAIMAATMRMVGEHFAVSVCAYADMEPDEDGFTIRGDWTAPGARSIVGSYRLGGFGSRAVATLRAGVALVSHDNLAELGPDESALFLALGLRATICVPLIKQGRLTALMAVHSAVARTWTGEEAVLLGEVMDRSWAHIQRVRSEAALREGDRRKDEFIATLAHELRNPLAPIRSAAQIARSPGATDAQRRWSQDVIERQVSQMSLLLDDLLDVSRITRGKLDLKLARVAVASVVETAIETARPLVDQRCHRLVVELPDAPVWIQADALRLAQVLSNLVTNAAKYSEPGGWIRLHVACDATGLTITVDDRGIGIDAAALPGIFEMFAQATQAIDRAEGGLGIGLALVKGLVALHGGTVDATSPGRGQGSRFTVRLPPSIILTGEPEPLPGARPDASDAAARRVLVVDDNRDAAQSLAVMLTLDGHEIRCAHDGNEALDVASAFRPEIVLLDIGMPGLNGYEVARRIRDEDWGRAALLVAVTGWGQVEDRRRASEAGFDHHLVKPVARHDLVALLAARAASLAGRAS